MRIILLIAFGPIFCGQLSAQTQSRYSNVELIEDIDYLYSSLQESHYNLFVNTPEDDYQEAYEKLRRSMNDSMDLFDAYRCLQPLVALAQNGHCQILPYSLYGAYYGNKGTVFPLNVCISNDNVCVTNNFSSDTSITIGDEIISVNGKSIGETLAEMHAFFSGESDYFINTLIEMLTFPRMYWAAFGRFDEFEIELRSREGIANQATIKPISTEEFERKNATVKPLLNNSREFKFIDNIAYLHPGQFAKQNAQDDYESSDNTIFCQFIDSIFTEIYKTNSENLIIDLRNNPGGHNSFSDYMLSYVADKPFRFSSKFLVKTSELTKSFWKEINDSSLIELKNDILTNENGKSFENTIPYTKPRTDSLSFKGNVYVLT